MTPVEPGLARRGVRYLARRRRVVAALLAWSVVEAGHTFALGYALAEALDEGFLAGRPRTGLAWLGLAAVAVVAGAYGTGRTYGGVAGLVEPFRDGLVRTVVSRALHRGGGSDTAAVSRLTHQVEIARDAFAGLVMVSRSFVFTAAGALTGLFLLAPPLLAVVAPPLVLGLGLFLATLRPLARRQEAYLAADETLAAGLGDVFAGLRDVTAAGAEPRVRAETGALTDATLHASRSLARWSVVRVVALALAGQLPVVLLLAGAPWLLDHGVTAGGLVGALAYLTQSLMPALQNLVHGLGTSGSRLAVVVRRLTAPGLPDGPPGEPAATATAAPQDAPAPALALRRLTFAYGDRADPVVRDLDLTLPRGAHLAVVGPSGVGKSTLAGLVAGLLRPGGGEVTVGGARAGTAAAAARRVLIPQEAYVFSGTVADNLGYLRDDPVPEEELRAAAEALGMAELVRRVGGFAAPLAPAELSAGERQQIALARAYLSPAPLAVLDEATSHLDPVAEARAERAFASRPGGTLVVIAHRAASARRATRILVMDGADTVCGEHHELLARSPLYRDLMGAADPAHRGPEPRNPAHRDGSSCRDSPSYPPRPLRDTDRVDPVPRPGLPGDRGHVVAHRPVGQVQAAGDLPDGRPLRRE
ncbi:ABC transporter ATP-binding protein [Streptomyces hiroshimensis]|uniref:ABC transporter ATP-binding protein n=1 Tax=Streptomyces hiroshimensis TaxID=66424 RepID=A0ABQ2Y7D4_9ACTN|nr:ABC transporter ATP-binding protein [Streptomyces hiroshimensis]GGX72056.1 ABC transporter ATP-binding protein [Streptomyces hiroshimensis]